ncbi:transposase [Mycoplasmatota bacterium]|nr:transposase [Mycoplasmatota bacterium]
MLTKKNTIQNELIFSTLDDLVPQSHLVRKLDKIDYSFIYDEVSHYYSEDGRPSIDPVILFKIILIKNIFGIKSIRQALKEIEVNLAYRWFLNIPLSKKVPSYSVISNNFNNRFNKDILKKIFKVIITKAINKQIIPEKDLKFINIYYKLRKNKVTNKLSIETDEESLYDQTLV